MSSHSNALSLASSPHYFQRGGALVKQLTGRGVEPPATEPLPLRLVSHTLRGGGSCGWTVIEAVVFDVDGVLVRSGAFGQQLRSELGLQSDELDAFWRGPFARCSLGLADLKQEVAPLLQRWGYPGTVEDCLRDWFEADSTLNPDVLDEVRSLRHRGVPCHVASNQEPYRAAYLESTLSLAARFERLFFSCRLGVKKPQLDFYRRVAAELATAPASLLFIDDQQDNVDAARTAGWSAERYGFGDDLRSLLSRYEIVRRD